MVGRRGGEGGRIVGGHGREAFATMRTEDGIYRIRQVPGVFSERGIRRGASAYLRFSYSAIKCSTSLGWDPAVPSSIRCHRWMRHASLCGPEALQAAAAQDSAMQDMRRKLGRRDGDGLPACGSTFLVHHLRRAAYRSNGPTCRLVHEHLPNDSVRAPDCLEIRTFWWCVRTRETSGRPRGQTETNTPSPTFLT